MRLARNFFSAGRGEFPCVLPNFGCNWWKIWRGNHIDEWWFKRWTARREPWESRRRSNRVARGKPNEPMTGGLAAALLPWVEKSARFWVGSSGRVRDGNQNEPCCGNRGFGRRCSWRCCNLPARITALLRAFGQFGAVAGAHSRTDLIRVSHEDYTSYRRSVLPSSRGRCCDSAVLTRCSGPGLSFRHCAGCATLGVTHGRLSFLHIRPCRRAPLIAASAPL